MISSFLASGSSSNTAIIHDANVTALGNNLAGTVNPLSFFSNNNPVNAGNNVKAGLCYIIFDDQFKFVSGGFDPVNNATSGGIKSHFLQNIPIPKNGYIYIYCSNESNINVFFDNLEVVHTRGQILEESHFYALGMRMEGICSKAANKICNKYQYNGKELQSQEFSDGSGLEEYDYGARFLDPQLGVWHNPDPLADISRRWSPYVYGYDNPIRFIDPDGMESVGADGLTNDQWVKSSRPGADANSAANFREENKAEKKSQKEDPEVAGNLFFNNDAIGPGTFYGSADAAAIGWYLHYYSALKSQASSEKGVEWSSEIYSIKGKGDKKYYSYTALVTFNSKAKSPGFGNKLHILPTSAIAEAHLHSHLLIGGLTSSNEFFSKGGNYDQGSWSKSNVDWYLFTMYGNLRVARTMTGVMDILLASMNKAGQLDVNPYYKNFNIDGHPLYNGSELNPIQLIR